MLRGLVLLLLLANAVLFVWLRSEPEWLQADRDPQRLAEQIGAQGVQALVRIDAKATASGAGTEANVAPGATATATAASAASAASGLPAFIPSASAPPSAAALAASGPRADSNAPTATGSASKTALACLESGALTTADWTLLARRVADAGVPPSAVSVRDVEQRGRWLVYMGRFTDDALMNRKAEELRRMNLPFERMTAPARLVPGLSLGSFDNPDAAEARLNEIARRGVRTARAINLAPPGTVRHMRLMLADVGVLGGLATERFKRCGT